jgi:hypothetical protein
MSESMTGGSPTLNFTQIGPECGSDGQKFVCGFKQSVASSGPTVAKLGLTPNSVKNSSTEFHENPTVSLAAEAGTQTRTDGRTNMVST